MCVYSAASDMQMTGTLLLFIAVLAIHHAEVINLDDELREKLDLRHYEILQLPEVKHRTKRYVDPEKTDDFHQVWIKAFGKEFHLSMKKSVILSHDFHTTLVHQNGSREDHLSSSYNFYSGTLHGEKDTQTNVYWEDGSITASIVTSDDVYFIEPVKRYVADAHHEALIAYRKSDMKVTQHAWDTIRPRTVQQRNLTTIHNNKGRHKRELDLGSRKYCRVMLVADHYFYTAVGHSSIIATQNYIIGAMDRVNGFYQSTGWPDNAGISGLGFEITKIIIHLGPTEGKHYNQANRGTNMDQTLDSFSLAYYLNSACLVHLFTYTSFLAGQGLAYVASWRTTDFGGMCSYDMLSSKMAGNTGLTSSRNIKGNKVLTLQASITTAHELGHNWGSSHDNPDSDECGDFYIMYPTSEEGYYRNNVVFSPCSRRSIYEVLKTRGQHCLRERNPFVAFCGNGRIDSGEECDSGTRPDVCCNDKCLLTQGADCSPYNKVCCSLCKLAPANTLCIQSVDDNFDCKGNARCNGYQYECPPPSHKEENTSCHNSGRCFGGQCVGFCQQKEMIPCICSPESGLACYRCCKHSSDSVCISFRELLDDGRTCYQGYCQAGVCKKRPSVVNKFWNALLKQVTDSVAVFMRDNIVFFITLFSLMVWLPSVIMYEYFEDKEENEDEGLRKRQNDDKLSKMVILPEDNQDNIEFFPKRSLDAFRNWSSSDGDSDVTSEHAIPYTGYTHISPPSEMIRNLPPYDERASNLLPSYHHQGDEDRVSTLPPSYRHQGDENRVGTLPPSYRHQGDNERVSTLPPSYRHQGNDERASTLPPSYRHHDYDRRVTNIPLTVDNLHDGKNYKVNVPHPRKYPSHHELGRESGTLPSTGRRALLPVDREQNLGRFGPTNPPHAARHVYGDDDFQSSDANVPFRQIGNEAVSSTPRQGEGHDQFVPVNNAAIEQYVHSPRTSRQPYNRGLDDPSHDDMDRRGNHGRPASRENINHDNHGEAISTQNLLTNRHDRPISSENIQGNLGNREYDSRYINRAFDGSMSESTV